MKKFKSLVFIDDNHPTNVFHRIVVEDAQVCESYYFFECTEKALEKLEVFSTSEDLNFPEIIFVDINMPVVNGWEFIERFKKMGLNESPKIIFLTTSVYHKDLEKVEKSDDIHLVINKPLTVEMLNKLNAEILINS